MFEIIRSLFRFTCTLHIRANWVHWLLTSGVQRLPTNYCYLHRMCMYIGRGAVSWFHMYVYMYIYTYCIYVHLYILYNICTLQEYTWIELAYNYNLIYSCSVTNHCQWHIFCSCLYTFSCSLPWPYIYWVHYVQVCWYMCTDASIVRCNHVYAIM